MLKLWLCSFTCLLLTLQVVQCEIRPGKLRTASVASLDGRMMARFVLEETNRFRLAHRREPLAVLAPLTQAAQDHATAMARYRFFAHRNPNDADQRTLSDRVRRVGLEPRAFAENIALNYPFFVFGKNAAGLSSRTEEYLYRALAKSVVQQWIDSPGHRKNLLARPYSSIGLGFAAGKDEAGRMRIYCVQTFSASS